jgi:hypothetical protein
MKNNTKIRLHLSNTLFESIVKEVLAEAKKGDMSGGVYTEVVKAKKSPEIKATDKMKKMEEMSSKEKMAKGMYKEVNAVVDTDKMRNMHEKESLGKVKKDIKALPKDDKAKLMKAKAMLEKRLAEMEINVAEEDKIEETTSTSLNELRKKTTK